MNGSYRWLRRAAAVLIWVSCTVGASPAFAQDTTGAAIAGVVKDSSGAVLPGVTVQASSPALIEKVRTTVTDSQGHYQIVALRPGSYEVSFTLSGFTPVRQVGVELRSNFTATVNAQMVVGGVTDTVTVTSAPPVVDVKNVTHQQVITSQLLDAVPSAKGMMAYAALMPSVVSPVNAQDVGGGAGEVSVRMSIHGGKQSDQKLLQDGMRYNSNGIAGASRSFYINPLGADETVIDVGAGGNAEASTGGVQVNLIPKDGGNRFTGTFFGAYTNHSLQSNNLTPALQQQGLKTVNGIRRIYDWNGVVGGPIVKNRLWFMSAHRRWGRTNRLANQYADLNFYNRVPGAPAADWVFTPDTSRPVDFLENNKSDNVRFTAQVSNKDKVTFSYDWQQNQLSDVGTTLTGGTGSIAAIRPYCPEPRLYQATWTRPATSKLLIEAGATYLVHRRNGTSSFATSCYGDPQHQSPDFINVTELSPRYVYGGLGLAQTDKSNQDNERVSASYITGRHNVKVGLFMSRGSDNTYVDRGSIPFSYTFRNGSPTSLTEYVSPTYVTESMKPELALYAQDQWQINRLTLNYGLRYESIHVSVPAQTRPATQLASAATFSAVDCVPCWHDVDPRVGIAYDLFGNGRTALKGSLDRFVTAASAVNADPFNPVNAAVNSTGRSWGDANGNFFPDCDLTNPAKNGECGPMQNQAFGQTQIKTNPDPSWINGWGKRGYSWQAGVSIDHELRPGTSVSAGYYRTWYGNFTVTDNLETTPADYDPYCITAPTDPRLPPSVSGQQICGLYDINPSKFGLVNNVVTLAKKFGKQTEVYNGVDVVFSARLPHGGQASGGWNIGDSLSSGLSTESAKTSNCFVVDSPQQLYNCKSGNPYQSRIKVNASYPLPWDILAAAVFQSLPSLNYQANYTVTSAQIAPSLGRPLAGNTSNVTIDLLQPYSQFLSGRINQLDLRVSKIVKLGEHIRTQTNIDLYNALNSSAVLAAINTYGASWLKPTQILDGRLLKFSVQVNFQ